MCNFWEVILKKEREMCVFNYFFFLFYGLECEDLNGIFSIYFGL